MFPAWCSEFGSGGKFKSPSKRWSDVTWVTLGACRESTTEILGKSTFRLSKTWNGLFYAQSSSKDFLEGPTTDALIRYQLLDCRAKRKPCNLHGGISPVKSSGNQALTRCAFLDTTFADHPGTIPNTSSLEGSPSSYAHQYPRSLPRILELYRRPFDFNRPRTGDENIHQSPGALLPVRAARHVGHPDQGAK
jgi:hypothetical protein